MTPPEQLVNLALASASGCELIVLIHDRASANVRWANNSMTTNGLTYSREWTAVAIVAGDDGTHVGTVTSARDEPAAIAAIVEQAREAALRTPPATDVAPLLDATASHGTWLDQAQPVSIDVFAPILPGLRAGFESAGDDSPSTDQLYGFAEYTADTYWLANTSGLRSCFTVPTGSIELNAKRGPANSVWVGRSTADFTDISVDELLAEARRRLEWGARRVELPAGRYPTILPPSAVADMLIYLAWSMQGRSAHEGRSALSADTGDSGTEDPDTGDTGTEDPGAGDSGAGDSGARTRLGERLTTLELTLFSDPAYPGLGCSPVVHTTASGESVSVFDNGMAIDRADWIRDGVINALAYSRADADEFGASGAATLADNLILTTDSDDGIDDLIARTEYGLLLTTLWYIREVDPATLLLTGLTRDGVYLVENGKVTAAVNNFRFNESPLDMLRRATAAGRTERTLPREWKDWFTRTAMPAMLIPDFNMSSVSQAT